MAPRMRATQGRTSSPYEILGISHDSTKAEIKKRYHELALRHHPDKTGGKTHELFVAIQASYEDCIKQAAKLKRERKREAKQNGPERTPDPKPAPQYCPPPPTWPLRFCPLTPPKVPPPFPADMRVPTMTHEDVLHEYNVYMHHLADVHTLAAKIIKHFLKKRFQVRRPEIFRAAEYVGRYLLAETRMHHSLFAAIEATQWWTKPKGNASADLARQQVQWYVLVLIAKHREVLKDIHLWLETFILDHIVNSRPLTWNVTDIFIQKARKWCPEDI